MTSARGGRYPVLIVHWARYFGCIINFINSQAACCSSLDWAVTARKLPPAGIFTSLSPKAGLDPARPPKTWEEVRKVAKIIRDKTGEYGFYMQEYQDNWATQGLLTSNGAEILKDNKAVFASKESEDAYRLYADMVLKDKSALHIAADEGIASFYSGKVGILMGSSAKIGTVTQSSKFNVMACPFPALNKSGL